MCGSRQHGFLKNLPDLNSREPYQVNCPITVYERGNDALCVSSPLLEYDICKHALAESIGHEKSRVPDVMRDYISYGRGRFQPQEAHNIFEGMLKEICDIYYTPKSTKRKGGEDTDNNKGSKKRVKVSEG
jgi:hypothetical protein